MSVSDTKEKKKKSAKAPAEKHEAPAAPEKEAAPAVSGGADPCKREIAIEVPTEVVARETETVLSKYQKLARLPGFRKGKAPAGLLRQRFGADIRAEMIESLVPRYLRQELEKLHLEPVSQPRVADLEMEEGKPLRFKASFDVLPPIEVSGYQELRTEKADTSVADDDVQKAVETLRQQHATYSAVEEDRALADGDFAQVSFSGNPKDKKDGDKPVNVDEILVEIGGSNTVKDFSEALRGAKAGEEREFDVTYAEDFADQRLAGKTIHYAVKVIGIKRKSVPELNDDFARELGAELQTVDDLTKRIREGMESEKRHHAEHEAKEKLLDQLIERNQFPVPESLVDRQVDVRLERGLRALAAQGMRTEDMRKLDLTRLRAGQHDAAVREVKASLILDKIAENEKIEVSDDDINKELDALAARTNETPDALRAGLTPDGTLDRIRDRIRSEKTLDFLFNRSA